MASLRCTKSPSHLTIEISHLPRAGVMSCTQALLFATHLSKE